MKKIAAFLTAFTVLMFLTACSNAAKNDNLFAENGTSAAPAQGAGSYTAGTVSETDESGTEKNDDADVTEIVYVDVCWLAPDEEKMYNNCDVIAGVTINSLEEIAISYTFMGAECTSYKTLASVSANKIYYSSEENISPEFIVSIPISSYGSDDYCPEIAEGESCILFISRTERLDDPLELYNYADYYLSHPADIININGVECTADEIFSHYSDNSVPVIKEPDIELLEGEELDSEYQSYGFKTGRCSMPLSDFENTLIEKINEKK